MPSVKNANIMIKNSWKQGNFFIFVRLFEMLIVEKFYWSKKLYKQLFLYLGKEVSGQTRTKRYRVFCVVSKKEEINILPALY